MSGCMLNISGKGSQIGSSRFEAKIFRGFKVDSSLHKPLADEFGFRSLALEGSS